MDRNRTPHHKNTRPIVALRKESVDRNAHDAQAMKGGIMSLSARRAWIEIEKRSRGGYITKVALRKESVDRNLA